MDRLIFNSGGIYHLYQLESHFRHRGGRHYHLADTDECLELLRVTAHSPDRVIQRHFRAFLEQLDPTLIDALRQEGVDWEQEAKDAGETGFNSLS
ncbi:hypothetical protein [Marinobacter sp. NFXS9]|uniref:hypothetical protein n=1 Tax=Marinobacter sp. NFXS9 TaxID=2818433 RepID=UPI0032DF432A